MPNRSAGTTDRIVMSSLFATLAPLTDEQLVNVEVVFAEGLGVATTINLASQAEGFSITGGNASDLITGGAGADSITAGAGNDLIFGFVGSDSIDGGSGNDTVTLTATFAALNTAKDSQLVNVEAVSASTATAAVSIALTGQSEGFSLTGGAGNDTLAGGLGADVIVGGAGSDVILGFIGADKVDGGAGLDAISLLLTSAELNAALDAACSAASTALAVRWPRVCCWAVSRACRARARSAREDAANGQSAPRNMSRRRTAYVTNSADRTTTPKKLCRAARRAQVCTVPPSDNNKHSSRC